MYFLFLGKAAEASFRNLRNKYGSERRKLKTTMRSGAGTKEVNIRLSELFPYLAWLEPHFVDREGITDIEIETTSKDDDLEEVLEEEQEEYEELAPSIETEDKKTMLLSPQKLRLCHPLQKERHIENAQGMIINAF